MTTQDEQILSRLEQISAQLELVAERQRFTEELVEEMMPIGRLVMNSATERLGEWEKRGVFDMLAVTRDAADRVLDTYTKEDAQHLADAMVGILDTVRRLTQPGVLQLANQASDVLLQGDGVKPVGIFGAMRKASSDEDIQRGLGVMLEVMRAVGRAQGGTAGTAVAALPPPRTGLPSSAPAPRAAAPAKAKATAAEPAPAVAPSPPEPEGEVVVWEGFEFDQKGFLIDPSTWNPELAKMVAAGLGIELTDEHMAVIEWVRADYQETGASPNVRRVANGSGVGTEAMYRLFPPAPGKLCAMISGVPKPVGCV